MSQSDALQQFRRPPRVARLARERHPQQHVLERRESGQQIERLKHEADVPGPKPVAGRLGQPRDIGRIDDDPAFVGGRQPGDHVEQRRLSAAALAANDDLLARC